MNYRVDIYVYTRTEKGKTSSRWVTKCSYISLLCINDTNLIPSHLTVQTASITILLYRPIRITPAATSFCT